MPSQQLHIEVDYYSEDEKLKLSRYSTAPQIAKVVANGCDVSAAQFLTYYLFHKKRPGKPGYRTYAELGAKIARALAELEEWVELRDSAIVSVPDAVPQDRALTERVGEAAALCVVSRIHDLHEADWEHIPEHPGRNGIPTFDYHYVVPTASDGARLVQVEAKGTSVADNTTLAPAVRTQKHNIDVKKKEIRDREATGRYLYPADLRYGIVSALGHGQALRCLLVDPPSDGGPDPRRHRLLARLRFMYEWVSFLSPRSQFASSFATRLTALFSARDPFEFTGVPLARGNGEPFPVSLPAASGRSQGIFTHLCRVADGSGVGTLVRLSAARYMFVGVRPRLFEMAATQKFDAVMSYRSSGGSSFHRIECVLPRGRARKLELLDSDDRVGPHGLYIHFHASGLLHHSEGDVVFGVVTPERRELRR